MPWSTSELAELAGTSLRTVRHYHQVGLLPEPERRANGYKSYGVAHLVRLVRIKRLADLGFSLAQIAEMDADAESSDSALGDLDAELAGTIERLQRAREEIGALRRNKAARTLPAALTGIPEDVEVPAAERSLAVVITQLLGPAGREAFAEWVSSSESSSVDLEFDALPADADEPTRADLAARMLPHSRQVHQRRQGAPLGDAPCDRQQASRAIGQALRELYNPAQLDVLTRVSALLAAEDPS